MTLILDLTPEQETRLRSEADRSGMPLPEYAIKRLLGDASHIPSDEAARLAAIDAAMGALAGSGISSEQFMREKHDETAREEARWQARLEKGRR